MASKKVGGRVAGRFEFEGLGDADPPPLKVERVDADGGCHAVELDRKGTVVLDPGFEGQRNVLELSGPAGDARRFHYDDLLDRFRKDEIYILPHDVWGRWRPRLTCVSGRVEVCRRPYFLDAIERHDASILHAASLGAVADLNVAVSRPELADLIWPARCEPVCDGRVSVYVRTCCCPWFDPGDILVNICEIIDCNRVHIKWPIEIDKGDPPPIGPRPGPGPDPIDQPVLHAMDVADFRPRFTGPSPLPTVPAHAADVADSLKRSIAGEPGLPGPDQLLELYRHHEVLSRLDPRAQVAYVKANLELKYLLCSCSMVKVAEVPIHDDGTFDACFSRPWAGRGCTQRVVYVVTQATTAGGNVIYDGRIGPRSFALDEEADLRASWRARTCGRDDTLGQGVFLNRIGGTTAANLVRTATQDGEVSFTALAATDGLLNGGANVWGGTLALRYTFHPSLKALGASHYRVRAQRVNDSGDAIGSPTTHDTAVAWGLFQGSQIISTALGPVTLGAGPGAVENAYKIPYYADGWDFDANSFHAFINTTGFVNNGRYLLVIDVFDAAGVRLVPNNSGPAGPGEAVKNFVYQRMVPSADPNVVNLVVVPHKALANLFKVDNTPAIAFFKGLHQSGSINADFFAGCQFLTGPPGDGIQLYYQAHHGTGWLSSVGITVTEGIGGPTTALLTSVSTPSTTTDTGAPPAMVLTPVKTIGQLLGTDPKCALAATMLVTTRHTNGSSGLSNLWASAVAAFALEQV